MSFDGPAWIGQSFDPTCGCAMLLFYVVVLGFVFFFGTQLQNVTSLIPFITYY